MEPLTTKQAGEILGVSPRRVIAMIEQGRLKARKFSNVYMIFKKDLDAVRKEANSTSKQAEERFISFADAAADIIGSVKGGPPDLSTNKAHMEGFGTKAGERAALARRRNSAKR